MASVENRTVEPDEAGMRLDRWFKAHFPDLSFGHLQKLVRSGQVRVDGGRVKTSTRLDAGQAIRVPPLTRLTAPDEPQDVESDEAPSGEPRSGKKSAGGVARAQQPRTSGKPLKPGVANDADFLR